MSSVTYTVAATGDKDFVVSFDYLEKSHLRATINGIPINQWEIVDPNTLRFAKSVFTTAGDTVVIRRETPIDVAEITFQSGVPIRQYELKRSNDQLLFKMQELNLDTFVGLSKNAAQTAWDAENLRLEQVGTPTQATDAVNKTYVDNEITTAIADLGDVDAGLPTPALSDTGRTIRLLQEAGGTVGVDLPAYQIGGLAPAEVTMVADLAAEPVAGESGVVLGYDSDPAFGSNTADSGTKVKITSDSSVLSPVNGAISATDSFTVSIPVGKFHIDAWATVATDGYNNGTSTLPHYASIGLRASDNTLYKESRQIFVGYGPLASSPNPGTVTLKISYQLTAATATDLQLRVADNTTSSAGTSEIYLRDAALHIREIIE